MITKIDCLNLLFELKDNGIDCTEKIKHLISISEPDIETIKFINDNREFTVRQFYEKLRHSYNDKKSKLYGNIVNEQKYNGVNKKELLCTLASLQLQILLFDKNIDDAAFLQSARFDEISKVLLNYYNTKDIIPCQRLLSLIKADLKVFEEISNQH